MLYFSYGTNMDPVGMRERAPGAKPLGAARLGGWRLTFTADAPDTGYGVPHVEPDENDEVWGVLWDVTEDDMKSLDEYEGVGVSAYVRDMVAVSRGDEVVEAITYLAQAHSYQQPSKEFVEQIVRGAEAHNLPAIYVERLRRLA
jgi:gamma-glutamylcyclotransferase